MGHHLKVIVTDRCTQCLIMFHKSYLSAGWCLPCAKEDWDEYERAKLFQLAATGQEEATVHTPNLMSNFRRRLGIWKVTHRNTTSNTIITTRHLTRSRAVKAFLNPPRRSQS